MILVSHIFSKEYSIEIYEWSGTTWEPYVANDVQVQFYMMSPYVLKTLSTDSKVLLNLILNIVLVSSSINSWVKFVQLHVLFQGRYFTSFKVPDVYGVFQFKVEYERLGYTSLSLSKQVISDPLKILKNHSTRTLFFPYKNLQPFSATLDFPLNLKGSHQNISAQVNTYYNSFTQALKHPTLLWV